VNTLPDVRTCGGVGSGLFRTDDGGDTWKRLDNVIAKTPGDNTGLAADASLGASASRSRRATPTACT
jgi:hypothetical protein